MRMFTSGLSTMRSNGTLRCLSKEVLQLIIIRSMALDGAFQIMYFINYEPGRSFDDSQDVGLAPTLAGLSYIFAAPREGCDNCGSQAEQALVVRDTSPITSQLLDYVEIGQLESMRPEHVKPFLIDRLRWRIYTVSFVHLVSRLVVGA